MDRYAVCVVNCEDRVYTWAGADGEGLTLTDALDILARDLEWASENPDSFESMGMTFCAVQIGG